MDPLDQFDYVIEMKRFVAELLIKEFNLSKTSRFYTNDKGFNVIGEYKVYRHNAHSKEASLFYKRLFRLSDNEALDWTKVRKYVPTITAKKQPLKFDNVEQVLGWIKCNKLFKDSNQELGKRFQDIEPYNLEEFEDDKLFNSVTSAILKYHGIKEATPAKESSDQVVPSKKSSSSKSRKEEISSILEPNDGGKRKYVEADEQEYFPTQRGVLAQLNQLNKTNNLNVKRVKRDKQTHV